MPSRNVNIYQLITNIKWIILILHFGLECYTIIKENEMILYNLSLFFGLRQSIFSCLLRLFVRKNIGTPTMDRLCTRYCIETCLSTLKLNGYAYASYSLRCSVGATYTAKILQHFRIDLLANYSPLLRRASST